MSSSSSFGRSRQQQHQSLLHDQTTHSFSQYYCMACCCPCLLMGNIRTQLSRESLLPCCRDCQYCQDCQMGQEGCNTCMWTCCLLLPCALPLACYSLHERYKLKLFYPDDFRLLPVVNCSTRCYYCCCWPVNVLEQHAFVHTLSQEGFLTFQWEIDHYHSHVDINMSKTRTHILLVFGSHSKAKIEFMRKLMMSVDRSTAFMPPHLTTSTSTVSKKLAIAPLLPPLDEASSTGEKSPEKENLLDVGKRAKAKPTLTIEVDEASDQVSDPSPVRSNDVSPIPLFEKSSPDPPVRRATTPPVVVQPTVEEEEDVETKSMSKILELTTSSWEKHEGTEKITTASADPRTAADTIHSWLRTLSLLDSAFLEFAEVWDVPPSQFQSYTVKANLSSAKVILYVVDPSMSDQDITEIKMQYSDNIKLLADHRTAQLEKNATTGSEEHGLLNVVHIVVILSSNLPSMQGADKLSQEGKQYASRVGELLLWARRLGSLWFHVNVESEDDYYRFTKQLMTLIKEDSK